MSTDRFDSPEEAARYGFPAECRIVAMRKQGDAAYVLLDTGPAGRPYLYGVNCQRRDGSWSPGASGNGPGWSQVGADKELGTLTVWGDAPAGAERVRVEVAGEVQEESVSGGAHLVAWWDVPYRKASSVRVLAFHIDGKWIRKGGGLTSA